MYYGIYHILLDEKGRLPLVSTIRDEVEKEGHYKWWITAGFDGQLFLYHKDLWETILKKEVPPSSMDPRVMDFRRRFVGCAHCVTADRQLRLLIPAPLRTYAKISRETVLLGIEDRMELWSSEEWKNQLTEQRTSAYKAIAMDLFGQHRVEAGQKQEDEEHVGM